MKTVEKILEGPGTRSVEDVHHLRLMALLKDMVRELGPVEAAEALGIDRKTVWRGLSKGRLSPRLADSLAALREKKCLCTGPSSPAFARLSA